MKRPTAKRQADTPETAPPKKPDLIQKALDCIEQKINAGEIRPTIGDLIRLLEIRQAADTNKRIVASWYNPNAPEGECPTCNRALTCPACGHKTPVRRPATQGQPPDN